MIQRRKFGLKRSCIFLVMNFWSLCPFSDFYLIFKWIFIVFLFKNRRKGGLLTRRCWCGVTRSMDLHQRECRAIAIRRPRWRPIFFSSWRRMERQISIGRTTTDGTTRSSSDGHDLLSPRRRVELSGALDPHRTDDDRGAAWSRDRDRPTYLIRSDDSDYVRLTIAVRLWSDRPTIGANSPPNRD